MLGKLGSPDRRRSPRASTTLIGGASAVIGLAVLVGWYTGTQSLARLYLGSEPMSYNVAAAFLFSGIGLMVLSIKRPNLVLLFGTVTIASGLIALIGLAFGLNLGIDLLLFDPFISEKVSHTEGMTTLTAVAFLLIGIALIYHSTLERSVEYPVSTGTLASLVIACGLAGLFGYLVSIGTSFQSYMPMHATVGILLIGIVLLNLSWSVSVSKKIRMPHWIPVTVGFAVSAVALTLFQALAENNREHAIEIIAAELNSLQSEVQVRTQLQIQALDRMASRWEVRRRTPLREWEADASLHLSDHSGYEALVWMDASNTVRWYVPSSEMESVPDGILHLAEPVSTLINNARLSGQVTATSLFEISRNQVGYVLCAPLFPGGQFDGYLLVAIQFDTFFESILAERTAKGYGIAIVGDGGDIYNVRPAARRYEQKWAQHAPILINDVELYRLMIWPTRPTMEAIRSPLAGITLSTGLLMALLLAFVTHFVQKSMRRSTELKISHQQVRKESKNRKQVEKRFRLFIENAPEAFVILDPELRIRFVNSRTEELFSNDRDNLIENSVRILFPERFRDSYAVRFANFDKGTKIQHLGTDLDLYAVRSDGQEFPVEIGLSTIEVTGKEWVLLSITDITVRKRAEKVLQQAHDELETMVEERTEQLREKNEELEQNTEELAKSNAELEQFAYVASHDLKEPLRTIGSFTQLLADRYSGKLDADADDFIAYVVDGVNRMQILIDELLAYSRVGTSRKPLSPTNVEVVVSHALANLDATISANGAIITSDALPDVTGDEVQLTTLFQNLIANAIKFQDQKIIEIHIGAENQEEESLFWVRDNGIGIDSEHAERVFQIFHQLHGRNEYEGTGMGLAICKKIIERHGGRIWVESELGKGSTFYFTIAIPPTGE